jgi:hypothetical protein
MKLFRFNKEQNATKFLKPVGGGRGIGLRAENQSWEWGGGGREHREGNMVFLQFSTDFCRDTYQLSASSL